MPKSTRIAGEMPRGTEPILFVDDDESIRTVYAMVLERLGYSVRVAHDGDDAVRMAVDSPCDLLVADFTMPGMSGPELIAELRQHCPTIRCLIISGHGAEDLRQLPALAGIPILQKPMSTLELAVAIRNVLDG